MNEIILYLIRHGKTLGNENKLYCGSTDLELSEIGRGELNKLNTELKYTTCKLNYTSGAKRANETFNILFPNRDFIEKRGFWEYDFGDFEMKSYEMLKADKYYQEWICDSTGSVYCPNGESRQDFFKRLDIAMMELFAEVLESGEKEALLVCHGGVIGTLLERYYDDSKDFFSYQPQCGRGYKVKLIMDKTIKMEVLEEI